MIGKMLSLTLIAGSLAIGGLIISDSFSKPSAKLAASETPFRIREEESPVLKNSPVNFTNVTQSAAKKVALDVLARNPQGPEVLENEQWLNVADPEKLAEEFLSQSLANFDYGKLKPEIKNSDLKIISDSETAKKNYFSNLQKILSNNAEGIKNLDHFSIQNLNILINVYEKTAVDLSLLPVPKSLAELHKEEISLITAQKNAFQLVLNYQSDPLGAALAMQSIASINLEFENLQKKFNAYAQN